MLSIEQLTQEVLSLPRASRELLAEQLVESLELDINPAVQTAWKAEARKRLEEIRSGAVSGIPGEDALARVRQILGQCCITEKTQRFTL